MENKVMYEWINEWTTLGSQSSMIQRNRLTNFQSLIASSESVKGLCKRDLEATYISTTEQVAI